MTSDTSNAPSRMGDTATPAAHKAAREGNPQQLLEKLPAMLHGVMIQCADVFKNPTKQHPRAIIHTNAIMRAGVPATVDRFQQALDMLEIEILKAKAVLHRDLTKFHTAAELARQKELEEEEERKAAIIREAEEKLRLERESEEAAKAALEGKVVTAAPATTAAVPSISTDLEMSLDEPPSAQPADEVRDAEMDKLFEDVQDVDSLKIEEDASTSAIVTGGLNSHHPLETSDIPLVAASAQKDGISTGGAADIIQLDDKSSDIKIKSEPSPDTAAAAAAVAATFEDPIILDSPLLPAEGDDEPPSAVDLFGEDPLNPTTTETKDTEGAGAGGNMSLEEQIDIDFLSEFGGGTADANVGGTAGADVGGAGDDITDDLFGDLDVGGDGTNDDDDDASKLDIMNLDIPGLEGDKPTEQKPGEELPKPADGQQMGEQQQIPQQDIDISALADATDFDDYLFASIGDGMIGDNSSSFDDAFLFGS